MRHSLPLILATLALQAGSGFCGPLASLDRALETPWPKNQTVQLVFHGHSVPAGFHKTPEVRPFESYPHLVHVALKQRYPHAVSNAIVTAIGGENSVAGAARFERDVLRHEPDVVFIDYALNDRRLPVEKVKEAWQEMIRLCKARDIPVVLITPTGDTRADMSREDDPLRQRADLVRELAEEEQVLLADVAAAWQAEIEAGTSQDELLSQVNHPNLRGHTLAAGVIMGTLTEAGLRPETSDPTP